MSFKTPILFLIFNRPDTTEKVFNAIKEVKPAKLFIAADGPRTNNSLDVLKCSETRKIIERVDWECDIHRLFREKNLGCRIAISSAIHWFFENVNEGIILEDDCLPSRSFFWFCQELLNKYRNNDRVMQINGTFYLDGLKEFNESYYFSQIISCWGWATWKSSWHYYDKDFKDYDNFKSERKIEAFYRNKDISYWMENYLDEAVYKYSNIWSTIWAYAFIKQNGLSITPTANLIQNIGFNADATTKKYKYFLKYMDYVTQEIDKIIHPSTINHDKIADEMHFNTIIKTTDPRITNKYKWLFKKYIKKILGMFKN